MMWCLCACSVFIYCCAGVAGVCVRESACVLVRVGVLNDIFMRQCRWSVCMCCRDKNIMAEKEKAKEGDTRRNRE